MDDGLFGMVRAGVVGGRVAASSPWIGVVHSSGMLTLAAMQVPHPRQLMRLLRTSLSKAPIAAPPAAGCSGSEVQQLPQLVQIRG